MDAATDDTMESFITLLHRLSELCDIAVSGGHIRPSDAVTVLRDNGQAKEADELADILLRLDNLRGAA